MSFDKSGGRCYINIQKKQMAILSCCKERMIQHVSFIINDEDENDISIDFSIQDGVGYTPVDDSMSDGINEAIILVSGVMQDIYPADKSVKAPGTIFRIVNESQNHNYNINVTVIQLNEQRTKGEFFIHSYEKLDKENHTCK